MHRKTYELCQLFPGRKPGEIQETTYGHFNSKQEAKKEANGTSMKHYVIYERKVVEAVMPEEVPANG